MEKIIAMLLEILKALPLPALKEIAKILQGSYVHLKRKHGKKLATEKDPKVWADWIGSAVWCAIRNKGKCPHPVGPDGVPAE